MSLLCRCELSDGHHWVIAQLPSQIVSQLQSESGSKIKDLTGALLSLRGFRLEVTSYGPSDEKLKLFVQLAKYRKGSVNIPPIGQPTSLASNTHLRPLFERVAVLMNGQLDDQSPDSPVPTSPVELLEALDLPSASSQSNVIPNTSFVSQIGFDLARRKVTYRVTLPRPSQIRFWGVPIREIAAIIGAGKSGRRCHGRLARNLR